MKMNMTMTNRSTRTRAAFTLTEMLIAVAILSVVILATSTIFGTAQRVASVGEANSDLVQQAAAIERRIRRDIQRMSSEGFLAIQCVSVDNGVNFSDNGRLLDPTREQFDPVTGEPVQVRCDQLIFFADGKEGSTRFQSSFVSNAQSGGGPAPVQGAASMIYLGHSVQMPVQPPRQNSNDPVIYDHDRDNEPIYPWSFILDYPTLPATGVDAQIITPPASNWILSRRAVLLADDDLYGMVVNGASTNIYPSLIDPAECLSGGEQFNSAPLLFETLNSGAMRFSLGVASGRLDITASELDDIRRNVCWSWEDLGLDPDIDNVDRPLVQSSPLVRKDDLLESMFEGYPRAERIAPSMLDLDQMLSNNVLAGNVSDFRVEWTWEDGVGRDFDAISTTYPAGLTGRLDNSSSQVWFGLENNAFDFVQQFERPVWDSLNNGFNNGVQDANNIEAFYGTSDGVTRYGAVFGYNRDRGFLRGGDDQPITFGDPPELLFFDTYGSEEGGVNTYSPWPTALRITMRLNDPGNVIEGGRVFQFVIPLPQQD